MRGAHAGHPLKYLRQVLLAGILLGATPSRADTPRFVADLVGASGWPSITVDRSNQGYLHLDLEREFPLFGLMTIGARITPLFLYFDEHGRTIPGLAFGLVSRFYSDRVHHSGLFGGIGISTIWSSQTFSDNASRLNFLSQLSFGYQSRGDHWRIALIFEHISNAATAEPNDGINGLGLRSAGPCES
jgi:hypothetical protein